MAKQTVTVGNAIIALAGNDDPFNGQVHPQLPLGPTKKQLGERSQAHIIARLLEVGYTVLTPYGDSSRYDLVIEDADGNFWKV